MLWAAEDEHLPAEVSLTGNIQFVGQTIWGMAEAVLGTRCGTLTAYTH